MTMLAFMQDKETQLVQDLSAQSNITHGVLPQVLIVLGSLFGAVLLAVIWLVFIRGKNRRRKRHNHHWRSPSSDAVSGASERGSRRRRRRGRQRNPTLAETRGLPPLRDSDPKPPPSY